MRRRAFSLMELVTVVVILGVIAGIALPRMATFAGSAEENALLQNLAILTKAVEHYRAEHDNASPTTADQLLKYTDRSGATSDTPTATHIFGPYLLEMPELPMGSRRGESAISASDTPGAAAGGWVIDSGTGRVRANLPDAEVGKDGVPLNRVAAGKLGR